MTLTIDPGARALIQRRCFTICTCWKITRVDGVTLRFTDFPRKIVIDDGFEYSPVGGGRAGARAREAGLQESTTEWTGVISSDRVTDDDLHAGRYQDAQIDEYVVDWRHPWAPAIVKQRYWIDNVKRTGETWTAQLSSIPSWLARPVGRVCSRDCKHRLGDLKCKVDVSGSSNYFATGVVSSVPVQRLTFRTTDWTSFADDAFALGYVTWIDGNNAGIESEIKSSDSNPGSGYTEFVLFLPTPFDIQAGDDFAAVVGCDGLKSTCITKFNNLVNFGGFPEIPGTDKVLQSPSS